jgi:hypothetical protein
LTLWKRPYRHLPAGMVPATSWERRQCLIDRTALAMATTLPALAVPAVVVGAISPDAELLRLGEQLDRVIADYNAQQLKDRAEREPFEVEVERVTGIARRNAPAWNEESPAAVAYRDARSTLAKDIPMPLLGRRPPIISPSDPAGCTLASSRLASGTSHDDAKVQGWLREMVWWTRRSWHRQGAGQPFRMTGGLGGKKR